MAQATLNATVVLGGKVDNSFTQLGDVLTSMGNSINAISQPLIDFGKQSIQVYRDYQDSMLDAQVALSTTYGRNTRELYNVMQQLDMQATEWAASSIFHTNDVGNAIAQAAHANWDLEMILDGIPAAMELAQAGSMDLSQAIDYIVKSTNAMGIEFQDVGSFIDEWTYAANSSAGTIETFGDAILRMGKTTMFAKNRQELLSMIAILHDAGATGAEAGTLLRNTMIRMVAPTDKAAEAMEKLGITQADIDEAMNEVDGDTMAAMKRLQDLGFSAYDTNGQLKSFFEIFRDIAILTEKMNDDEKYDILSAFFPTRTITGALALMEELGDGFYKLYDDLESGKAEGYGEYASETMMSGLTGALETLTSKWEKLQQVTGEALSGQVEAFAEAAGGFIDKVSNMPEGPFNALVSGLQSVALLGPGLLIAGKGMSMFGNFVGDILPGFMDIGSFKGFGNIAGVMSVTALAITAFDSAMTSLAETDYKDVFGGMSLDMKPIKAYAESLTEPFKTATEDMRAFQTATDEAIKEYEKISSKLSGDLTQLMITEKPLTPEDKASLLKLGESMYTEAKNGINQAYKADTEAALKLFGGDEEAPEFQTLLGVLEDGYSTAIERARTLSNELKEAMTSAFSDGILDESELGNIREYMKQLNELLAMETEANNYAATQKMIRKAQTMGLDSANEIVNMFMEGRDSQVADVEDMRDRVLARLDKSFAAGFIDKETYSELVEKTIEGASGQIQDIESRIDAAINRTLGELVSSSDVGYMDKAIAKYAQQYMENPSNGMLDAIRESARADLVGDLDSSNDWMELQHAYQDEIKALGGIDEVIRKLSEAEENGYDETASFYRNLLAKNAIVSGDFSEVYQPDSYMQAAADNNPSGYTVESARQETELSVFENDVVARFKESLENPYSDVMPSEYYNNVMTEDTRRILDGITTSLGMSYDLGKVLSDYMPEETGEGFERYAQQWAALQLMSMDDTAAGQYKLPQETVQTGQTSESEVNIDTSQAAPARSEIESTMSAPIDANVSFDGAISSASSAVSTIKSMFQDITANVKISTSGGASAASLPKKAEGGRADTPVVFGEAGPEWFIPEERTPRTADLLLQAAEASGFSLSDLAEYSGAAMFADGGVIGDEEFAVSALGELANVPELDWGELTPITYSDSGGSSDGGSSAPIQVQYSPVIHADNADGVDRVLQQDKARMMQLFEEWIAQRDLIESVSKYR